MGAKPLNIELGSFRNPLRSGWAPESAAEVSLPVGSRDSSYGEVTERFGVRTQRVLSPDNSSQNLVLESDLLKLGLPFPELHTSFMNEALQLS